MAQDAIYRSNMYDIMTHILSIIKNCIISLSAIASLFMSSSFHGNQAIDKI